MADNIFDIATDLKNIRMEQARLLKARAGASALIVQGFIAVYGILIASFVSPLKAFLWLGTSTAMVCVTLLYAKLKSPKGISEDNYKSYLTGHTVICGMTGLVWGGFAIYIFDWPDGVSFIIAGLIPLTITVGGMLPSSAYQRGYLFLAGFSLLPVAAYLMLFMPGTARLLGLGVFAYFGFGVLTSTQAELNTRDGIIARTTQKFTKNLLQKNQEIQKINEEKSRLLAGTSHDFSQPLHAQGYYIEALARCVTTDEQKALLGKIEDSWCAQRDLLNGIAEIARLENGAITPKPKPFLVRSEVQKVVSEFQPTADEKDINFKIQLNDISIYSDPALVTRILRNLLDNAIKFTPIGGQVTISSDVKDDQFVMSIIDTGQGVSKEDFSQIFDPYFQLESDFDNSGSGLGLSIVNRLCELLDIDIGLASEIGKGAHFTLTFLQAGGPTPMEQIVESQVPQFDRNPLVVLIDDEDTIRDAMAAELTCWGMQVIAAATCQNAVSLLSDISETPALLIVDKRLRLGETGINAINVLREEVNETIPAILMTGDINGFEAVENMEKVQVLIKPILPSDLKATIDAIMP